MEEKLKELMHDLGNAINESLSDSERIAGAIGEIRRAGYDVFLVLEATIGFNKRDGENEGEHSGQSGADWTAQDQKFLKALKISLDDDSTD